MIADARKIQGLIVTATDMRHAAWHNKLPIPSAHFADVKTANSVRFDIRNTNLSLQTLTNFGRYLGTLGGPRVMQFALRYDF